jgi:hypothetical protein
MRSEEITQRESCARWPLAANVINTNYSCTNEKDKIYATVGLSPLLKRWAPEMCTSFPSALSSTWGKRLGRSRLRWEDTVIMDLQEIGWKAWSGLVGSSGGLL